jgi:hypothetical protein
MTTTTTTRRMTNSRTMTFFAVVSSSLLFLFILFEATSIGGVHAQKELAFEQNPSSSLGKTTTRTPTETITAEDDDDSTQKDAYGNKGGGEWTFATPASKGLSQSSLEVRSFFLYLSLSFCISSERAAARCRGRGTFVVLFFLSSSSLSLSFNHLLASVSSFFRSSL